MSALPERMHLGVSTPRPGHSQATSANPFECLFEAILNSVAVSLALPAGEIPPVIADNQLEPARFTHLADRDNLAE